MVEAGYFFHVGDEQAYVSAEKRLLSDKNSDRSPNPDLTENETADAQRSLSSLLNLALNDGLNKDGSRKISYELRDEIFSNIDLLAPRLGLTLRQKYNLIPDIRWKKYCLIPQSTAPPQPHQQHRG